MVIGPANPQMGPEFNPALLKTLLLIPPPFGPLCCSHGNGVSKNGNGKPSQPDAAYLHEEDAIVSILQPLKAFG